MNNKTGMTRAMVLRKSRNEGIVRDFKTFPRENNAIGVIVSRLAKKWRRSETTVREVLTTAGLIGRNASNDK